MPREEGSTKKPIPELTMPRLSRAFNFQFGLLNTLEFLILVDSLHGILNAFMFYNSYSMFLFYSFNGAILAKGNITTKSSSKIIFF